MPRTDRLLAVTVFAAVHVTAATGQTVASPSAAAPYPAASSTSSPTSGEAGSVVLVEELLRADNQSAREALRRTSMLAPASGGAGALSPGLGLFPSGMPSAALLARPAAVGTPLQVLAVFGVQGKSFANIVLHGSQYTVEAGTKAGDCIVEKVAGRCVVLRAGSKKAAARQCPTRCWTGERLFDPVASGLIATQHPVPLPLSAQSAAMPPAGLSMPAAAVAQPGDLAQVK